MASPFGNTSLLKKILGICSTPLRLCPSPRPASPPLAPLASPAPRDRTSGGSEIAPIAILTSKRGLKRSRDDSLPMLTPGGPGFSKATLAVPPLAMSSDPVRADIREVKKYKTGSFARAVAVARDPAAKAAAWDNFMGSMYTPGSLCAEQGYWSTWVSLHREWHGDDVPALPLTEEKVYAVCCLLMSGDYRAIENYTTEATERHQDMGFEVPVLLRRAIKKSIRSATRGLGPSRQANEIDFMPIVDKVPSCFDPVVPDGPVWMVAALVVAISFLLREVELAGIRRGRVVTDRAKKTVTIELPSSKTDPRGRGAKRTWGCVCSAGEPGPCPYCAILPVLDHHDNQGWSGDRPLFGTRYGDFATKEAVVRSLISLALLANIAAELSGHSFRVTGARMLAAMGIAILQIQLLGRWDSGVVLRYVTDAPLLHMTRAFVEAKAGMSINRVRMKALELSTGNANLSPARIADDVVTPLAKELDEVRDELHIIRELVADDIQNIQKQIHEYTDEDHGMLRFEGYEKCHFIHVFYPRPPQGWRTRCGLRFAGSAYHFVKEGEVKVMCKRCKKLQLGGSSSSEESGMRAG